MLQSAPHVSVESLRPQQPKVLYGGTGRHRKQWLMFPTLEKLTTTMIFRITGADSRTGVDRMIFIRAKTEEEAIAQAQGQGVIPYDIAGGIITVTEEQAQVEAAERERRAKIEKAERILHLEERVNAQLAELRNRLEVGKRAFLYDSLYIPVDSILSDEELNPGFDIGVLTRLGLQGWEVVQAIPRTAGVAAKNKHLGAKVGESLAGVSGGNVVGVHVILRKEIDRDDLLPEPSEEVKATLKRSV